MVKKKRSELTAEQLEEIEANAFAVELLIPRDWIKKEPILQKAIIDYEKDIEELAEKYQVSILLMTFRLQQLDLTGSPF